MEQKVKRFPISFDVYLVVVAGLYFATAAAAFAFDLFDPKYLPFILCVVLAAPLILPMQRIVRVRPFWSKK